MGTGTTEEGLATYPQDSKSQCVAVGQWQVKADPGPLSFLLSCLIASWYFLMPPSRNQDTIGSQLMSSLPASGKSTRDCCQTGSIFHVLVEDAQHICEQSLIN